jgi:hypothetical protein
MVEDEPSDQAKQFGNRAATAELQTKQCNEKLNSLDLIDELHQIASCVLGLELAIIGASKECQMNSYGDALAQLAQDIALDLEALERKFRDQRRDEER